MNHPESYPHGEAVAKALRENSWHFSDNGRFPRPEIVDLSLPEKVKMLSSCMQDLGGLLHTIPYLSESDDREKGISRLPYRIKLSHASGSLPTISHISFSFYDEKKKNVTGTVIPIDTPYKLVVGMKVQPKQGEEEDDDDSSSETVSSHSEVHTFTHFFSSKGDSLITFTPAPKEGKERNSHEPVLVPLSLELLDIARDNLWLLYQKAVSLAPH